MFACKKIKIAVELISEHLTSRIEKDDKK